MNLAWRDTLAPTGVLRVAINLGNAVLAQRQAETGALTGVSVDLAQQLADLLALPIDWQVHDAAGKAFDAVRQQHCDLAFLAVDPLRGNDLAFTTPYVLIEGAFMVHADGPVQHNADVDQPGHRLAANSGSAYDLHLSRTLQHAHIERRPTAREAFDWFVQDRLHAAAGVRQVLDRYVAERPALRVLPEPFMQIQQAMAVPRGREAALPGLTAFLEDAKASGRVAQSLQRSGQRDATVAPAASPL